MPSDSAASLIRLRGVRQNNLKNFDIDLPLGHLIVVTGLSGSGKSSLAFETLYAEGQRRYIETFSPYARQFFDRMDKPQVDSIQGIPPAIAITQRNAVKSTRSTVGTMTELCDYMKAAWTRVAQLYCRSCGQLVRKDPPQFVWENLQNAKLSHPGRAEALVTFDLPLSDKLPLTESMMLLARQGYQQLLLTSGRDESAIEFVRVDEAADRPGLGALGSVTVLQDRIRLDAANRARFIDACEQAYHFGKSKLAIRFLDGRPCCKFSNLFHCGPCDLEYREPLPALFSFNHPAGACPACRGFGRIITIDYGLVIPNRSLSLSQGAVRPWQSGQSAECQHDLIKFCRKRGVPLDIPFQDLPVRWQNWVIEGDPDYGKDAGHEWPHAWYGVKGYFRWLESKAYKMHVRVLLSRYRTYQTCPDCKGQRFQPETLLFKAQSDEGTLLTLADFYQLPVNEALCFARFLAKAHASSKSTDPVRIVLDEVCARLAYLEEVGLGYLALDRPTRSLSGGETERVNLTTCLGSRLVNTLYVLDEPSVGLHPRDTERLITILKRLRDSGNTVLVVEHEASVMRAADQIVDLGPGHGETGGRLVFQGTYEKILQSSGSLTGQYLRGEKSVEISARRPVQHRSGPKKKRGSWLCPLLTVSNASCHNLRNLSVTIPLERFVCVTGVSGSGKTTLIRDILLPWLGGRLQAVRPASLAEESNGVEAGDEEPLGCADSELRSTEQLAGWENLGRVVLVDQSPLARTPRSTPAVYVGAFDHLRELFAQTDAARRRGLNASSFSFNSPQGQCELCRGAGFEKIEMQFLSDVYIRCPACRGRRYREHILEVTLRGGSGPGADEKSIAGFLDASVEQAAAFLQNFSDSRPALRAVERLNLLQKVGLGYLRLGQPINTLSGGESQRLKLAGHLAEFAAAQARESAPTLFLFDEPTTGLHFDDVRVLIGVFQGLVDQGHSVIVIEHNLDLIKCADWLIDMGPEAGEQGGQVVITGTPEEAAACLTSHTGRALRKMIRTLRPNS
jgi:excinuclease ABC subunit A